MRRFLELALLLALVAVGAALALRPAPPPEETPFEAVSPAVDSALRKLRSADWGEVNEGLSVLEAAGPAALPGLVRMMGEDRLVHLRNTFDLIYPGATEFYGHGLYLDYDVDWLPIRAGWIMERITLEEFGFAGWPQATPEVLAAAGVKPDKDGFVPQTPKLVRLAQESPAFARHRAAARARARAWWARRGATWTRLDGVEEALASDSTHRQSEALQYLLSDLFSSAAFCPGLTRESYTARLAPHVVRLRSSPDEYVRRDAVRLAPAIPHREVALTIHGRTVGTRFDDTPVPGPPCGPVPQEDRWQPDARIHVDCGIFDQDHVSAYVTGDRLELEGRVVARVGDPVARVTKALGAPYLHKDNAQLDEEDLYATSPQLRVESEQGRITEFALQEPEPPVEPWTRRRPEY